MNAKRALTIAAAAGLLAAGARAAVPAGRTDVGCRVELDRGVLPAETATRVVVKVTLDAPPAPSRQERPPVNLAIVLDRSGSMSGEKIEKAREAAVQALRRLNGRDAFSLVAYNNSVETIVPAQRADDTESIEPRIRAISAQGSTALFGGVSQGAQELRKNLEAEYVPRLILLSDGLANVGPSSPEELARLGTALRKEGVSVTTIGVGTDYNEDLMTRLAQNSDGNSYFVAQGADLPRIFAAELGDVLSVVAREVRVQIECPPGIRPVRIIGRDGRIDGSLVELQLSQLYGSQEKYALVELELPAFPADRPQEIVTARVSYESAVTREKLTASAQATAQFSAAPEEVERSVNVAVQREIGLNAIALAKDAAVELNDKGQRADAVQELRVKSAELSALGAKYDIAELQQQAAELQEDATELEEEGMSKEQRKNYRTDSFRTRNQQRNK